VCFIVWCWLKLIDEDCYVEYFSADHWIILGIIAKDRYDRIGGYVIVGFWLEE